MGRSLEFQLQFSTQLGIQKKKDMLDVTLLFFPANTVKHLINAHERLQA